MLICELIPNISSVKRLFYTLKWLGYHLSGIVERKEEMKCSLKNAAYQIVT